MESNHNFIRHTYTKYLATSMLAILGSVLGQMVNNILVGNLLGAAALSVIGITLPIHYVFATLGALIGIGGMAYCARLIGKGSTYELREAFTHVYLLTVVIAAAVSVFMLANLDGMVRSMDAPGEFYGEVHGYAAVMVICGIFNMAVYPAYHLLRLDGRTWQAVCVFAVMAIATCGLDLLFLVGLKTGVLGAALAYGGGLAAASTMGALLLFFKNKTFGLVRPDKKSLGMVPRILKLGSPSALENLCILLRVYGLNFVLTGVSGVIAVSAFNVTNTLTSFAFIFIAGVSGSIMPFAGVLHAEFDVISLKQLLRLAFQYGMVMAAALAALCILFAPQIATLFGMGGPQEQPETVTAIIGFALALPPFMANSILICLYQCTGRSMMANVLTALRGFVLVFAFAVPLSKMTGTMGVWSAFWISDGLTFVTAVVWAAMVRRKNPSLTRLTLLDERVENEGEYIAFSVHSESAAIAQAAEKTGEFCEENGLSPKHTMAISLALEEFCGIIGARNSKDPNIMVRILVLRNIVVLRIRDTGAAFDPVAYYRQAEERGDDPADTLGVKLVLGMADKVDYRQTFGANNVTIVCGK